MSQMKNYVAYGRRDVAYNVKQGCTHAKVPVTVGFKAPAHITSTYELESLARAAIAKRYKTAWLVSWNTPDAPAPHAHRLLVERGWF